VQYLLYGCCVGGLCAVDWLCACDVEILLCVNVIVTQMYGFAAINAAYIWSVFICTAVGELLLTV